MPEGALRFIMSLRATGEGHISSIEFRTGLIKAEGGIRLDPISRFVTVPELDPNPTYKKAPFVAKLQEMGFDTGASAAVMEPLEDCFTRTDSYQSVLHIRRETQPVTQGLTNTLTCGSPMETEAGWLAITHGVGPMRKYCIGAALLDLQDPTKDLGRLREPLVAPEDNGREGHVPKSYTAADP